MKAAKAKDKAKSKDIQNCYDTNFCAISQHSNTAHQAAEICIESAENSIKKNLEFIDSLISVNFYYYYYYVYINQLFETIFLNS